MCLPKWLPPMQSVSPWTEKTFEILYKIFNRDFKITKPMYGGYEVWFFPEVEDGKELIFWHLTHRSDKKTGERLPDLRRSERLPWARKMIDNSQKPEIWAWDYREGEGKTNTYVWLKDHDFLVLMRKYKTGERRLLTSFYIDYQHYKRKLERKYYKRIK